MNASVILSLPPETLATIPAGNPPAGVQALSQNPVNRGWILITVSSILFFMATICFIIRVYARIKIQRKVPRSDLYGDNVLYWGNIMYSSIPACGHSWWYRWFASMGPVVIGIIA
ncbi:hypothetical protein BOTCAL_0163g00150 [Botryotinia calthae]|uniref:Uncharacterized protein n=1 Tax=Botryotinia calthae TaxID=38488 RepID=A0A4Y8D3Z7_9HELO|nr:hypothetical protein BOTCAL_0163g00150 [Botryotinia calthae]